MGWFQRQIGSSNPRATVAALQEAVDGSGLALALDLSSGRPGLRRFIVHLGHRSGRFQIAGVDSERLPNGGPPDAAAFSANAREIEAAVGRLKERLPDPFTFHRLAVGFVRDGTGEVELQVRFDEDVEQLHLTTLRLPKGTGVPMEDAAYQKALDAWGVRINAVRSFWLVPSPGEAWRIEGRSLRLSGADGERRFLVDPIAAYVPSTGDFRWLLPKPAAPEAPFQEPDLLLDQNRAMELAVFAAARLGKKGVFQGTMTEPAGMWVFAGIGE